MRMGAWAADFFREDDMSRICSIPIKSRLKVRTAVKAGGMTYQHSRRALKVRAGLKAGGVMVNHNRVALALAAVLKHADVVRRGLGK